MSDNTIHTSDIRRFKMCRGLWNYASPLRLNRVPRKTKNPFLRGRVWHEALAAYHGDGLEIVGAFEDALVEALVEDKNQGAEYQQSEIDELFFIGRNVLSMYPEWAQQNLLPFVEEVIDVEVRQTVPLIDGYDFAFKADMVVRHGKALWIVDFKTTKTLPDNVSFLDFDEQITGYLKALEIYYGVKAVGAIFVYLRYYPPHIPDELKSGGLTRRKDLVTTPQIYFDKLKEIGEDPREYKDVLKRLKHKVEWFKRVDIVKRPQEKDVLWKRHKMIAKKMVSSDVDIYFSPSKITCAGCGYQTPCLVEAMGKDPSHVLNTEFVIGKEW